MEGLFTSGVACDRANTKRRKRHTAIVAHGAAGRRKEPETNDDATEYPNSDASSAEPEAAQSKPRRRSKIRFLQKNVKPRRQQREEANGSKESLASETDQESLDRDDESVRESRKPTKKRRRLFRPERRDSTEPDDGEETEERADRKSSKRQDKGERRSLLKRRARSESEEEEEEERRRERRRAKRAKRAEERERSAARKRERREAKSLRKAKSESNFAAHPLVAATHSELQRIAECYERKRVRRLQEDPEEYLYCLKTARCNSRAELEKEKLRKAEEKKRKEEEKRRKREAKREMRRRRKRKERKLLKRSKSQNDQSEETTEEDTTEPSE